MSHHSSRAFALKFYHLSDLLHQRFPLPISNADGRDSASQSCLVSCTKFDLTKLSR